MTEHDWDAPDDDVVDFEEMDEESKKIPQTPASKPKPTPKYEPTPRVVTTPEPPPQRTADTDKQEKVINAAIKSAQKLSKELETLDYQIEKFNKFEQKVSSFKIKNGVAMAAVGLILGAFIGSFAQSELNSHYIKTELSHKLKSAQAKLNVMQELENAGFGFATTDDVLQVYSKTPKVQLYEAEGFKILQLNKK